MGNLTQSIPNEWKIKYYALGSKTGKWQWYPILGQPDYPLFGKTKVERITSAHKMKDKFIRDFDGEIENIMIFEKHFNGRQIAILDKNTNQFTFG